MRQMLSARFVIITLLGAGASMMLNSLWPASVVTPSTDQLPFFIVLGVLESLAFGAGLATLSCFGQWFPKWRRISPSAFWTLQLALVWTLVNWWFHDHLHMALEHHDLWGLLVIEWLFHAPGMIVPVIIIAALLRLYRASERTPNPTDNTRTNH